MPAILNWVLRLLPTNPICMRLVQGGSKRARHLMIRMAYLGVMVGVLLLVMMPGVSAPSMRELASAGATMFQMISYLQVTLICLLTPVFMAGAIAQEANPQTWDILLTTPLNSLQIVLGNLFGRLFFVLALLFSTLPLFVMTQYFGGVPGWSIGASYMIAACSALLVAAIAVMLSVTRTAGRRAVFVFYVTVVMYLFVTYAGDLYLRGSAVVGIAQNTTILTPINPFLALEVLLNSNKYAPHVISQSESGWFVSLWLGRPVSAFCWTCVWMSVLLMLYSTLRLRAIGTRGGSTSLVQRLFKWPWGRPSQRRARRVGRNPIAWRESVARGGTMAAMAGRWGFMVLGVGLAVAFLVLFRRGVLTATDLRLVLGITLAAEVVIIVLVALNTSATAVSREREDGTLDIILTTPIQPGEYLAGKLRGLIQFLLPMLLVPTLTMILAAVYVMTDGLGGGPSVMVPSPNPMGGAAIMAPVVMPIGAVVLPFSLVPFVAFCVMIGLQWSIRSKGTISSVIAAVGVTLAIAGAISLCGFGAGKHFSVMGAVAVGFSPVMLVWAMIDPVGVLPSSIDSLAGRGSWQAGVSTAAVVGAVLAGVCFAAIVLGMHTNMKRTFMTTVRRLAGST